MKDEYSCNHGDGMQRLVSEIGGKIIVRLETHDPKLGWCRLNELSGAADMREKYVDQLRITRDRWVLTAPWEVGPMRISVTAA